MTLQHALLLLVSAWLWLATLILAAVPAHIHEARQGPISIIPLGPGPVSIETSSTSSGKTMSPTSTTSPSGTSSYAAQPSSSPSSLKFTVQNMTTCTSGVISWNYSGKQASLLLSITNIGVTGDLPRRFEAKRSALAVQQQLVNTSTSAHSWTWSSVNVSEGWYEIQGYVLSTPAIRSDSIPFFISNGTDVSCLAGASLQASSTASPSATVSPVPVASKSNVTSIVGGVIGGVAGLTLVIVAGLCLRLRRRKKPYDGGGGRQGGAWGSLKSTSSSIHPAGDGAQPVNNFFHAHTESTGAILQDPAVGKVSVTTTSTPGGSDEDGMVVSEEKLVSPASSSGMTPFDALNTPVHFDRRASVYSTQTPTVAASDSFRSRVPSVRSSNQSLEQQAQRIRSSMETSGRRRSERLSMPTLPSPGLSRIPPSPTAQAQSKEEYPLTPVNRSISAGAVSMSARRTSRKPVPHYDPSILLEDKNTDSASTLTAGADSSQSHGTGLGTGGNGTASDLVLKGAFVDGRPVHYLIPDLPPPPQD